MSLHCDECSVSQDVLNEVFEFGISRLPYMGHTHCHFAVIYSGKGKSIKILSYGFNHIRHKRSIHAEVDAINNLPPITRKKKKLVKVSLLVIRISRGIKKITSSKCCVKCCEAIYIIPPLRGYTIDNVAFSNYKGNIEDYHPIELLLDNNYHTSVYYSKRYYVPKIRKKVISQPDRLTKMFLSKKDDSDSE